MTRMLKYSLLLAVLQIPGCWPGGGDDTIAVTYIGNEGFLIRIGETKVLIDALSFVPRTM